MRLTLLVVLLVFPAFLYAQHLESPLEKNNFSRLTSYAALSDYINELDQCSDLLSIEIIGQSVEGRNIYAMKFSDSVFGEDETKIRVLIFAQQHGNEQSGKEGVLLLASSLLHPENRYLLHKMDVVLIPQLNPDGAEKNQRRNLNNTDLNRNHLLLTEPETQALHRFFDKFQFEVTLDVHEYYTFYDEWKQKGYRKNSELTAGICTNINIPARIRKFSSRIILPFILKSLNSSGYSSFEYCPGGPPGENYFRHSTFDINDGRQSFGIQNTFSFIQEGMNGEDSYIMNIKNRAVSQKLGMLSMIKVVNKHKSGIKKIVRHERNQLRNSDGTEQAIQMKHISKGKTLVLPVYSYLSGKDSSIQISDYRSEIQALSIVRKPKAYLIPKTCNDIVEWAKRHEIALEEYQPKPGDKIEIYFINKIDSIDFEGDIIEDPDVILRDVNNEFKAEAYYSVSVNCIKGNMLVAALEPKSMLGLVTYRQFKEYLKKAEYFPVLRVSDY